MCWKTLKFRFWGNRKIFEILFPKNSWRHRFTFCVQISRKLAFGKFAKCVFRRNIAYAWGIWRHNEAHRPAMQCFSRLFNFSFSHSFHQFSRNLSLVWKIVRPNLCIWCSWPTNSNYEFTMCQNPAFGQLHWVMCAKSGWKWKFHSHRRKCLNISRHRQ